MSASLQSLGLGLRLGSRISLVSELVLRIWLWLEWRLLYNINTAESRFNSRKYFHVGKLGLSWVKTWFRVRDSIRLRLRSDIGLD